MLQHSQHSKRLLGVITRTLQLQVSIMRHRSSVAPSGWCGTLQEKEPGPSTSSAVGCWCGCRASAASTASNPPSTRALAVWATPSEESVLETSAVSCACARPTLYRRHCSAGRNDGQFGSRVLKGCCLCSNVVHKWYQYGEAQVAKGNSLVVCCLQIDSISARTKQP